MRSLVEISLVVLKKDFQISLIYFHNFIIISHWKKVGPFIWEKIWIFYSQGCIVPSLTEIDPVVLEKKIFKFRQYIFTLLLLSHRGKGLGSSFEQTWIPFTYGCFVRSLVEIGPEVLAKKKKMWKVYDDDRQKTNCDQKSSLEPSAQVS